MMTKKCRDCGKEFTLTDGEIDFYNKKGLHLPERCADCRKKKKSAKADNAKISYTVTRVPNGRATAIYVICVLLFIGFGFWCISEANDTGLTNNVTESITEAVYTTAYEQTETAVITEAEPPAEVTSAITEAAQTEAEPTAPQYRFRNAEFLEEHYEKHGIEMGFASAEAYEKAASAVISADGVLHKLEKEDGDDVYYLESTNEFVIVSTDGYIRTYFKPDSGKDYFDRQ